MFGIVSFHGRDQNVPGSVYQTFGDPRLRSSSLSLRFHKLRLCTAEKTALKPLLSLPSQSDSCSRQLTKDITSKILLSLERTSSSPRHLVRQGTSNLCQTKHSSCHILRLQAQVTNLLLLPHSLPGRRRQRSILRQPSSRGRPPPRNLLSQHSRHAPWQRATSVQAVRLSTRPPPPHPTPLLLNIPSSHSMIIRTLAPLRSAIPSSPLQIPLRRRAASQQATIPNMRHKSSSGRALI